jgi:hypothetical protein
LITFEAGEDFTRIDEIFAPMKRCLDMSNYWQIQGTISHDREGWRCNQQIPTFYLNPDIQGIVSPEHALVIARSIIDPGELSSGMSLTAYRHRPGKPEEYLAMDYGDHRG